MDPTSKLLSQEQLSADDTKHPLVLPPLPSYYSNRLSNDVTPLADMPDPFHAFPAIEDAWSNGQPFRLESDTPPCVYCRAITVHREDSKIETNESTFIIRLYKCASCDADTIVKLRGDSLQ
jgi:hypothetical protein